MKIIRSTLLIFSMSTIQNATAQIQKNDFQSIFSITGAAGIANYYGDLTESSPLFKSPSYSFTLGASYKFKRHFNVRADISFLQVKASDNENSRIDLKARNLNFKSSVWDFSIAAEYDILDLNNFMVSPYFFLGIGAFNFNPYTIDRTGVKRYLQPLGTEGQGLAGYPDRHYYKKLEAEVPIGFGLKWPINDKIVFQLEFKYRKTNTDYIDDVSRSSYPSKVLLDARDPITSSLTYRGDEIGSGPYPPLNTGLNRGNPKINDSFYTTQIKFAFNL